MKKTIMTTTRDAIRFWAQRFADHFDFILVGVEDKFEKKSIPQDFTYAIEFYKTNWQSIAKNPSLLKDKWRIIEETLNFKNMMRTIFSENNIPCWPDLMEHMIEELTYFVQAILKREWTFQKELSWWANEHAENLEFVNCMLPILVGQDLPELIAEYGKSLPYTKQSAIKLLKSIKKENTQLANAFKNISRQALEQANISVSSKTVDNELLQEFMSLKQKHIRGIDKLLSTDLPLKKNTRETLDSMLLHERKEALFAQERLEAIYNTLINDKQYQADR